MPAPLSRGDSWDGNAVSDGERLNLVSRENGHGIAAEAVFARLEAKYRLTCEALEDVDAGRTIDHEAVQAAVQAHAAATVEMPEAAACGEAATGSNNA